MWKPRDDNEKMSRLAVLAAAAREAEELLAAEVDEPDPAARQEADRRLQLFMRAAREMAR